MRLLIVKTASMGDVVQALPVVADILRSRPAAAIDWLVESPNAAIPQLHGGVRRVLPVPWRKWRQSLWRGDTQQALAALKTQLREARYDLVLDLQGQMKSMWWARMAGAPVAGFDARSSRDALAAWGYALKARVDKQLQPIQRYRQLAASHLGYVMPKSRPDFGLRSPKPGWKPGNAYAVIIPNASHRDAHWPERHWSAVGKRLLEHKVQPLVLWSTETEQTLAERIAADCNGDVPPRLKLPEIAALLAGAKVVVGVDAGLTHLGAALGSSTLAVICGARHEPAGSIAVVGSGVVLTVGQPGAVPGRAETVAALDRLIEG